MNKKKNRMGQAARMKALVRETIVVVIVGVVLLITSMISNFLMADDLRNQVDITKALEEYRLASKEFTVDAQSYVVTGEEHFYEALTEGKADAALAASLFHFKELEIKDLKDYFYSHESFYLNMKFFSQTFFIT